ncbi:MAG: hypothetical protein LBU83_07710 [Bacteroidales bacterium]|jgi:hypothetical protein|nr:hypothetical protein [Bacteroidales bacterium]
MKKNYLFVFMLFALCKFTGHAQLIQNISIEEATTVPFYMENNSRIYHQIQLFGENFDIFLDNGAPKTMFPSTIIEKFTVLPDSLICQTFPKLPNTKDYKKRVVLGIGNYDLILDTIRCHIGMFQLGAELFERRIVNLDFVNETLTLSNALPEDIDTYIAIDMSSQKHENRFGVIQHYFLIQIPDFKGSFYQNIPLVFNVDLGGRTSVVSDKTIEKVDYTKFINDPTLISYLFSSEIMFNRPNLRVTYSDDGKVSEFPQEEAFAHFDGWIGVDILKRFHHVIFDYQGKKFYVKTLK